MLLEKTLFSILVMVTLEHHWIVRSRIIIGCRIELNLGYKPKVTSFQIVVGV